LAANAPLLKHTWQEAGDPSHLLSALLIEVDRPSHLKAVNAALEALGTLFANSGVFAKREIGRSGSLKVYAPASLSYGGVLAWAWLWGKHSGDFNLNDDLEKTLREQRLRNLKVESAA